MRKLALLFFLLFTASAALGQKVDIYEQSPFKWLKARARAAKDGKVELVRMPLAHQSLGWGCTCPMNYIGADSNVATDDKSWIRPVYTNGTVAPAYSKLGWVVVVEGYFTGETFKEESDEEGMATVYEFKVTKLRPYQDGKDSDAVAQVILLGEEARREVTKLTDNKPWLVLTKSISLLDKDLEKNKTAALKRLTDAGYSGAEILDSRQTTELNCCYAIVIAGRYATEEEAKAALKEVKKKFKGSYIKKGW